jgi:zinc transport system substrate-binding protein
MRNWLLSAMAVLVVVVTSISWWSGCGSSGRSTNDEHRLKVVVSILPQAYLVERIGGDRVQVTVMVPPGSNPATYEPKSDQVRQLSSADAYVRIRVPFEESWMAKFAALNPEMKVIDQSEGIDRIGHNGHSDGGEHGEDPHIWLSPTLMMKQAEAVSRGLEEMDPENRESYRENLDTLLQEISTLDRYVQRTLSKIPNRTFITFHPSWTYFARDYGLRQVAVEVGGKDPSASELAAVIEAARREKVHVVFAAPQFSTKAAEVIAQEIGGEVVLIDPLARDWNANLRHVADTFAKHLRNY